MPRYIGLLEATKRGKRRWFIPGEEKSMRLVQGTYRNDEQLSENKA